MPGFSAECEMGQHPSCAMPQGHCRCSCHAWTRELYEQKANPADRQGGIRRKGKARDAALVVPKPGQKVKTAPAPRGRAPKPAAAIPPRVVPPVAPVEWVEEEEPEAVLLNSCPKCLTKYKATDQFCRKDGTRLCLGKPCPRCEAPADEPDEWCWQCGWRLCEKYEKPAAGPMEVPMRGRPMPSLTGKEMQVVAIEFPGAPAPELSLPPGAAELLSERHPGTVTVESQNAAAEQQFEEPAAEDPISRLRRQARERGLLPPEIVVS